MPDVQNPCPAGASPAPDDDRAAASVALVIVGATGDLTRRLLLPGLARALTVHDLPEVTLVGSAHSDGHSLEEWRGVIEEAVGETDLDADARAGLVERAVWRTADASDPEDLGALLVAAREAAGEEAVVVLYLALDPDLAAEACAALEQVEDRPEGLRIVLEKPFGSDQRSARELNALLGRIAGEEDVFRVDHFLRESMVSGLLTLRTANRVLERVWSAADVEHVDIVADESLALEGRAGFYDGTGALEDMLQSHLLQVLAMVALEPPRRLTPDALQDAVVEVLRATRVRDDDAVASSRRARYTAGTVGGQDVPDYVAEEGVDPENGTETLAEVELEVRTDRWAGVPFRLRSGKALEPRRWEVVLSLRPPEGVPAGLEAAAGRERIVVGLDPRALRVELAVDGPDTPFVAERSVLAADLAEEDVDAYGEVMRGVLTGDRMLSVRGDAAEECWRILAPVIEAWDAGRVPLDEYAAGSSGPGDWPER